MSSIDPRIINSFTRLQISDTSAGTRGTGESAGNPFFAKASGDTFTSGIGINLAADKADTVPVYDQYGRIIGETTAEEGRGIDGDVQGIVDENGDIIGYANADYADAVQALANEGNIEDPENTDTAGLTEEAALAILQDKKDQIAAAAGAVNDITLDDLLESLNSDDPEIQALAQYLLHKQKGQEVWEALDNASGTSGDNTIDVNQVDDIVANIRPDEPGTTEPNDPGTTEPNDPGGSDGTDIVIRSEEEAVDILLQNQDILTLLDGNGDGLIHYDHLKQLAAGIEPFESASPEVRAAAQFYVDNEIERGRWDAYQARNARQADDSLLSIAYLQT
jgi:hypothetical protein